MNLPTHVIITIDGSSGAGKSTLARHLATQFGLLYIETGAMYRAIGYKSMIRRIDPRDPDAVKHLLESTTVTLQSTSMANRVYLDGADVTNHIYTNAVAQVTSYTSAHPVVQERMIALQREMGKTGGIVMEGRNIGTSVFPNAEVKFFLDAALEIRSSRQNRAAFEEGVSQREISKELQERDERDRNREQSSLRRAPDAISIDTTHMAIEEVIQQAIRVINDLFSL